MIRELEKYPDCGYRAMHGRKCLCCSIAQEVELHKSIFTYNENLEKAKQEKLVDDIAEAVYKKLKKEGVVKS